MFTHDIIFTKGKGEFKSLYLVVLWTTDITIFGSTYANKMLDKEQATNCRPAAVTGVWYVRFTHKYTHTFLILQGIYTRAKLKHLACIFLQHCQVAFVNKHSEMLQFYNIIRAPATPYRPGPVWVVYLKISLSQARDI